MMTPRWCFILFFAMIPASLTAAGSPVLSADELHQDAPPFTVQKRNNHSKFEDCSDCHEAEDFDPEPRRLRTRHVKKIDHGGNRFWCYTCHAGDNIDYLRTSSNERIEFAESYKICGSCHADRTKDWYYGAHGKRVSGWQGDRVILVCTHCHDPHKPAVAPRAPLPRPPVRVGLDRQETHQPEIHPLWERKSNGHKEH